MAPKNLPQKPVLLDAIEITLRAIEQRGRLYRSLVATVSAVSVLSIFLAALFHQRVAIFGFVLLVPLTGGFLFVDSRLVHRWRALIVEMAKMRHLDTVMLRNTISGFRYLPPNTLKSMLSTIPARQKRWRDAAEPEDTIVDADFDALERKTGLKTLRFTGLLTGGLVCLVAGAFYGSVALLLPGVTLIILLAVFGRRCL